MKGYRIAFIRHGITEANEDGRYIGTTDLPLSSAGAQELFDKLEKLDYPNPQKVYISPLKRCKQTASIIYPNCYTVELPELREMDFGKFENKKAEELMDTPEYKQYIKGGLDNPPPGGESARDMVNRCYEAIKIIISDMMYEGLTSAAVVTHGGIIMNMLSCFGVPKRRPMDYACDFGEGFEVLVTASMWQRSEAFEVLGRYPDRDPDENYGSFYDEEEGE
ncbi:MAG: histidine phosphatase family protein [Ruminococcus sp.]|uniref:Fructose-2,6-bisphosphatase n=1 Tax=Ruminococcus albus SY3 TaxID=1341156 RepID=A0A011VVJ1_RUMAL|nr:histidine phosphatase family protein [Ruminococcus albus]EXM39281.1 fructose-2,6-bisphosphatase [Ruminococcus albus SY3]MBE6868333.1 histidine phosphatase family protein [Ruminococcus albus]MBP5267657.1 histidine phosphatase family protein [Ruminococcus sp.]